MKIGMVLKQLRLIKGVSQIHIAQWLNLERSTYSKWENDKVMLRLDQIELIANYYGLATPFLVKLFCDGYLSTPDTIANIIHSKK